MEVETILKGVEVPVEPETQDYKDEEGLLVCGNCHTRRQYPLRVLGGCFHVGVLCRCRQDIEDARKAAEAAYKRQEKIKALRRDAFPDGQYIQCSFDQDDRRNPNLSQAMERYAKNWPEMRQNNLGLLLHGPVGTGKTFFAACIANALIQQEVAVQMSALSRIIRQLQGGSSGRQEQIERLVSYPLLILDDLGGERQSDFVQEQVLHIIDARYRTKKPLIVTTNISMEEIKNPPSHQLHRIYDRILEMCHPVLVPGESRRRQLVKAEYRRRCSTLGLTDPESGIHRADTQSRLPEP